MTLELFHILAISLRFWALVLRVSIKMQKNELRVNFYTRVLNTNLAKKANAENPTLSYQLTDTVSVEFRRVGGGDYALGLYVLNNGSPTYNTLVESDGGFIPSKANASDIHILGMQELLVSTSEGVEPFEFGEVTGSFNQIDGAKRYFFIAMRCNYGFVSGVIQNDTQITVRMINASNARHTLNSNILVIAYK